MKRPGPVATTLLMFMLTLGCVVLAPVSGAAQSAVAAPVSAPVVTGRASAERVRFTAPSNVIRMQIEIYAPDGRSLFDATGRGSVLDWNMLDGAGAPVSNGNYLCVITVKTLGGKLSQRIGNISIADGKATLPSSRAEITTAQALAIGPIEENSYVSVLREDVPSAAVVGHTGTEGQVTATTGDLTLRTGDVFSGADKERVRITQDGKVGIGTSTPESALDVAGGIKVTEGIKFKDGTTIAAENGKVGVRNEDGSFTPDAAGTGTVNRIAKWNETGGVGTLTDAAAFETAGTTLFGQNALGQVGLLAGNSTIFHVLEVGATGSKTPLTLAGGSGVMEFWKDLGGGTASPAAAVGFGMAQPGVAATNDMVFSTFTPVNAWNERMRVTSAGNLGLGTNAPVYKLDVLYGFNQGIRSKTTAGFATVDVDASNGDASFRMARAGVLKWGIQNNPANDDFNLFQYNNGSKMSIDGTTGGIMQPLANSGLVKAAIVTAGGATPTIARQFNNLPAQATITITSLGTGAYEVGFGDNVSTRFYSATLAFPTAFGGTGQIFVSPRSGNNNALFVQVTDSTGANTASMGFSLLVY